MPLARIGATLIFYAHIPKTGGSSVETYLERKGPVALKFPRRMGWSKSTAQHMEARIHRALVPDGMFDHAFTVLRDPVRRMVSEYRYQCDRSGKSPEFPAWVQRMLANVRKDPYTYDNHLRPQVEYVRPGMRLFLFEDGLDAVFDWIDAQSDGQRADRDVWEKKSASPAVEVPEAARAEIESFYADDLRLIAQARATGSV